MVCTNRSTWGPPGSSRRAWRARIPLAQAADSIMGEAAAVSTGRGHADSRNHLVLLWRAAKVLLLGSSISRWPPMELDEGSTRLLGPARPTSSTA
jgi:hypothetical protein